MFKYITVGGGDLTTNNPHPVEFAACIVARHNNGVSHFKNARTGILVRKVNIDDETSFCGQQTAMDLCKASN